MSFTSRFGAGLLLLASLAAPPAAAGVPDGSGGILTAFTIERGGRFVELFVQRIDAAGTPLWTTDGAALAWSLYWDMPPVVAADGAGGAIVAWQDFRDGAAIYVQRVNASGAPQWTPEGIPLCTSAGWGRNALGIVPDGAGGAIVLWTDHRTGTDLYAQRVSGSGVIQWAAGGIGICVDGSDQRQPAITADGFGGAIIVWEDGRNSGTTGSDIYAQHVSGSGFAMWPANGLALCTASGNQTAPKLVTSAAGVSVVAWCDDRGGAGLDLYAQRVAYNGGTTWTAGGVALCTAPGDQNRFDLATDGANGAIVAWFDLRSGSYEVYAARVTGTGAVPWTVNGVLLRTGSNLNEQVTVASDGAGGAIVAWRDAEGGWGRSRAQHVSSSGAILWAGGGVPILPHDVYEQSELSIVPDGAGGVLATWLERGVEMQYFAQRVDGSGAALWSSPAHAFLDPGAEHSPAVIPDGSGGTITAWAQQRGVGHSIEAKRLAASGATLWARRVVSSAEGDKAWPSLAGDGAGGVIVTWTEIRDSADIAVVVQHLGPAGDPMWPSDGVRLSIPSEYGVMSGVVSDGADGAVVVWQGSGNLGQEWRLRAQRIDAGGTALWAAGGVPLCDASGSQIIEGNGMSVLCLVPDGAGGAMVAWTDWRGDGDIYAQRVSGSGSRLWGTAGLAVCATAGTQSGPVVAADGMGGIVVAWSDRSGGQHLGAQRVSGAGACLWQANGVPVTPNDNVHDRAIASDGAGGAIVAWCEGRTDGGNIYVQRLAAATGAPVWAAGGVTACAAAREQFGPSIYPDGLGGAAVTWVDDRAGSGLDHSDVYAQRITVLGVPMWPADGVEVCTQPYSQLAPGIVADAAGGFVVTWLDRRDGTCDHVYAQRFNSVGVPLWAASGISGVPGGRAPLALAVSGARPNPSVGAPRVAFSLATAETATLELLDVSGRRIESRPVGGLGPGEHVVRLGEAAALPPGVYLVRLSQGGRFVTGKVCIVSR